MTNELWNEGIFEQVQRFADHKISMTQKITVCTGQGRQYCGKMRECLLSAFSCFPILFFKAFLLRVINPFPNKPWFLCVCITSLLKTLQEKDKLLVTSNFSFYQCFLPVSRTFSHFQRIQNCHLQTLSVWKILKFVI